jgi:hypothetical protein
MFLEVFDNTEKGSDMIKLACRFWVVSACTALFVVAGHYSLAYSETEIEIKGTVFAVDQDSGGAVVEVSILDPAGNEYFVAHDQIGDQLLKMVEKNVKVTGVISESRDGRKHIRVRKFEIIAT